MGTRGYIGIHSAKDNFFRGIYNHYDSYPTGLGEDMKQTVKDFQETELLFHLKNTKIVNEADECPSDILAKMKEKRSNGEEGFLPNMPKLDILQGMTITRGLLWKILYSVNGHILLI